MEKDLARKLSQYYSLVADERTDEAQKYLTNNSDIRMYITKQGELMKELESAREEADDERTKRRRSERREEDHSTFAWLFR